MGLSALGLGLVIVCAPRGARADGPSFVHRFALRGEAGVGTMLSAYQRNVDPARFNGSASGFDLAIQTSARLSLSVFDPIAVQLTGSNWFFPSSTLDAAGQPMGRAISVGGGVRFEPALGSVGRLYLDANLNAAFTGPYTRALFDAGLGFEFNATRWLALGPVFRYGQVFQPTVTASGNVEPFPYDAQFWSAGLSVALRVPAPPPAPPAAPPAPPPPLPPPPAPPRRVLLGGTVTASDSNAPIADAVITVVTHPSGVDELSPVASNAQGVFRVGEVTAGRYALRVRAPEYQEGTCETEVSDGATGAALRCALTPLPRVGVIEGRVTALQGGAAVGDLAVHLTPRDASAGATARQSRTGPDGAFAFRDVLASEYTLLIASGPQTRAATPQGVTVRARETARLDVVVGPVDTRGIAIARGAITVREQVHFQTDSADIMLDSNALLERIADFITRHPELRRVEVQGHTDNRGALQANVELSQRRAEAVRAALVALGVAQDRLSARGYGPERPIASNVSALGRARNRRVVFSIVDQEQPVRVTRPAAARGRRR